MEEKERGYKKIQVTDSTGSIPGLSFNVKYEKMDRGEKVIIEARVGDVVVTEKQCFQNQILAPGMIKKNYIDSDGNIYPKDQIKFYHEGSEIHEKSITRIFQISAFQQVSAYTDMYVIDKFYEIFPDDGGCERDYDKKFAVYGNTNGMRLLWEYLTLNNLVARGEFNTSSRGFLASDAYIRAISFGDKWGMEIGVFKEEKVYKHLQDGLPAVVTQEQAPEVKRAIKRV